MANSVSTFSVTVYLARRHACLAGYIFCRRFLYLKKIFLVHLMVYNGNILLSCLFVCVCVCVVCSMGYSLIQTINNSINNNHNMLVNLSLCSYAEMDGICLTGELHVQS